MNGSSVFIPAFYLLLPAAAVGGALWQVRRTRSVRPWAMLASNALFAAILSAVINFRYAMKVGGSLAAARPGQVLLGFYLALGVLWMFRVIGLSLKTGFDGLMRVRTPVRRVPENDGTLPSANWWMTRAVISTLLRAVVLFAVTLAFVLAMGIVYRPKLASGANPFKTIGAKFEEVRFEANHGPPLAGWWIPAGAPPSGHSTGQWGQRTVVLCHGVGVGKVSQLPLARELLSSGYNILLFDFRGFGDSGGQLQSFGDAERDDVLGAVQWLRQTHPQAARRIFGVGFDTGAAALIAAAGENSDAARAIDGVAVFGAFDDLSDWSDWLTGEVHLPVLSELVRRASVPLADLHAGTSLARFSPGELIDRVAPRPVFILHARGDSLVPFEAGVDLFEHASQPKLRFWAGQRSKSNTWVMPGMDGKPTTIPADAAHLADDPNVLHALLLFFETEAQKL